ncbi:MAG: hypothetical protein Q7Q71_06220 [Verrucomicrobiota bacterium JB023]|nr:hypothetical protein [Verrucomicrobiota bacterium JB023]
MERTILEEIPAEARKRDFWQRAFLVTLISGFYWLNEPLGLMRTVMLALWPVMIFVSAWVSLRRKHIRWQFKWGEELLMISKNGYSLAHLNWNEVERIEFQGDWALIPRRFFPFLKAKLPISVIPDELLGPMRKHSKYFDSREFPSRSIH